MKTMTAKYPGTCFECGNKADKMKDHNMSTTTERQGPPITQVEFEESDFPIAEKIAKRLGFTQTAYTSSSDMWGLFCLPDRANQRHGCIIKTEQFGFLFVADLEDMHMEDLQPTANAVNA